jgi:hypothetical protein
MSAEPVKLMVRLPREVHERLRKTSEANDRSLNAEIVHALKRYAEGAVEVRYVWDEPEADARRAWVGLGGETLDQSATWEHSPDEEAEVAKLVRTLLRLRHPSTHSHKPAGA